MSIIDHVNLPVSDLGRSQSFYEAVLVTLGFRLVAKDGRAIGFGVKDWGFGIVKVECAFPSMHVAFKAASREHATRFYSAALRAGARSNGAPSIRPQYDPSYFAAFVFDPDGHNVEAVYRGQ